MTQAIALSRAYLLPAALTAVPLLPAAATAEDVAMCIVGRPPSALSLYFSIPGSIVAVQDEAEATDCSVAWHQCPSPSSRLLRGPKSR